MSVLYVTYDGLLEPMGASQVVPYVTRLARRGFDMEVLSFEKPRDAARTDAVTRLAAHLAESGVRWTRLAYHARPAVPATMYDAGRGALIAVARALVRPGLIVHARSLMPAMMGLPAWLGGARLILDTRGMWIDERIESGRWRDGSLLVRAARQGERAVLRTARLIVHQTHQGQDALRRIAPDLTLPESRVIPTCADLARFTPAPSPAERRAALGLAERPVLVHSGTLGGWYLAEQTFEVARAFVRATWGTFLVLTREAELAASLSERIGVPAVIRAVAPQEMPAWLGACDAGLALVRPTFAKSTACPVKVGEYLGVGLAVGATRGVGDLERQFAGSKVAFAVAADDPPERLAALLVEAVSRPRRSEEARALGERFYDLERGVEAYAAIYRELGA
ncbi:MAG: glycosyltransferase family 4 protein [Armatimonadetes bacterium]|nr:glycosyltransferase family 4 protein [Armatimonadota bacterium]